MEILKIVTDNIYFNFLGFGSLLGTIFTLLAGIFFLTLKNRSQSTTRLGFLFFTMGLFNFFYVVSSVWYHPYAAFHRWGTVALILPVIIFGAQWALFFPNEAYPRFRKILLYTQWAISIGLSLAFFHITLNAPKKFHFTGHYWDFDAENISKVVAIAIFSYILIFILTGIVRAIQIKTQERWAVLKITLGFALATLIPSILNVMSRDGLIDRGTFMTTFVLMTVLGFFFVILFYFDSTQDRTTFMAKIVGISLVTFLLLMQGLSFTTMQDREKEYDALRKEYAERVIEGGKRNESIQYILLLQETENEKAQINFQASEDVNHLDYPLVRIDMLNSIIYSKIQSLPEENFETKVKEILENSHPEFVAYKNTFLEFLDTTTLTGSELKAKFIQEMNAANKRSFVHTNKISNIQNDGFCQKMEKYIAKMKAIDSHFKEQLTNRFVNCKWDEKELDVPELKREMFKLFRYLKPVGDRIYRKTTDGYTHYVGYMYYIPNEGKIYEVGFSYLDYRKYMHESAREEVILLFVVLFVLLVGFPYFFHGSLIKPLNSLLRGVARVNRGDLDVVVPIKVQDEIGFISDSFNKMVASIRQARRELEDYAQNLEEKVKERTREVQEKMEEVQALKIQQDGDYFLTSLLAKPLFYNANKSQRVTTEFIVKQKKQFQFRNKQADLGGDICVTGNLRLGTPEKFKRYIMAMNGDAMGKSMQGAGGSLVMGVVMNSIMARSAANNRILDITPEQWLTNVYHEVNSVFKSFNGTMVISATILLVDEETGKMYYWNAEHPFTVLYRDGIASFIEEGLRLRKLGLESEYDFEVFSFQLLPGDVVILGSDGRDDINLTPNESFRVINEDETLFLKIVEQANGELSEIERIIKTYGEITDDLSLLRLCFLPNYAEQSITNGYDEEISQKLGTSKIQEINRLYQESKKLYFAGDILKAKQKLEEAYLLNSNIPKLNKLYGLICFKTKDYQKSIQLFREYLEFEPNDFEISYYLFLSHKKMGMYEEAISYGEKLLEMNPNDIPTLTNLSHLYRIVGNHYRARELGERALHLDSQNESVKKILASLQG